MLSSGSDIPMIAIGICFSMTDIFRSEIFGVVMNQLVDEPVLPTLFLRTVSIWFDGKMIDLAMEI